MSIALRDQVLRDAADARPLAGLSGASVYLVTRDGRHWFVRKAARSVETSPRLKAQARKQRRFELQTGELMRTPRILDEGTIEGRYFFDMEFVRGPDATSYLRQATYAQVASFTDRLTDYLAAASTQAPLAPPAFGGLFEALFAKLCEVQQRTQLLAAADLARLFLALETVRSLPNLTPTLCHGDLTLQNMIVTEDGALWAVDLLDSSFEHYWQDVAKLHQDLAGGWFLREEPPVAQCVLDFVSRRVLSACARLAPGYLNIHFLLVGMAFVRILPYARSDQQRQFVAERIEYFAQRCLLAAGTGAAEAPAKRG